MPRRVLLNPGPRPEPPAPPAPPAPPPPPVEREVFFAQKLEPNPITVRILVTGNATADEVLFTLDLLTDQVRRAKETGKPL